MAKKFSFKEMIETAKKAPKNQQLGGLLCLIVAVGLVVWYFIQFFI